MSSDKTPQPENMELSDQDLQDLRLLESSAELPVFHSILEVWRAVLEPAKKVAKEKITPQWATRMVQSYHGLTYSDLPALQERYFSKILQLLEMLELEIASDDQCLTYHDPAEDNQHNAHHYKNLLLIWQQSFLQWELDWDPLDPAAAAEIAALAEVHKVFFGQNGITAFLDNIKFEYTEDDQQMLSDALSEQRVAHEAREAAQ